MTVLWIGWTVQISKSRDTVMHYKSWSSVLRWFDLLAMDANSVAESAVGLLSRHHLQRRRQHRPQYPCVYISICSSLGRPTVLPAVAAMHTPQLLQLLLPLVHAMRQLQSTTFYNQLDRCQMMSSVQRWNVNGAFLLKLFSTSSYSLYGDRKSRYQSLLASLAICRPSGCTEVSGVVVVVGVCNCSRMRTSKCTCLIFGVNVGLDPG